MNKDAETFSPHELWDLNYFAALTFKNQNAYKKTDFDKYQA